MKLKLQDYANIADIVSGIAITITLIFLILGVKENTEILRVSAFDRNMDSLNQVRSVIDNDPRMAANYRAVDRGEWATLSLDDKLRIRVWFEMLFGVYEKTYFARKYGQIDETEWGRFQRQVCIQRNRVAANDGMTDWLRIVTTKEFFEYMDESCSTVAAPPRS